MLRLLPAMGAVFLITSAGAHESSSPRYTNLSASGAQATFVPAEALPPAPAKPAPSKPRKAPAARPAAAPAPAPAREPAAPPPPARGLGAAGLAALALALCGGALAYRRARSRRRAEAETFALAAHELKSPLAAIESYLDLMASEARASPEARRWLEDMSRMRTTTAHLRRTITDILDMTRVEDGRMKLSARPVDLAALARASIDAYAPHAASRGVELGSVVPGKLPAALADPDRLRQVLDNLIGNAIKFTPSGRGVTVAGRESPGTVVIEVRDEGVGVPPERRARLFGKFQRLGPAVDGTEGTGLGLYLSRRLVAAQGGRLEHEPGEKGGSVFRVTLPRA